MQLDTKNIKSFYFRYWWIYYLLFFFFLGILVYALMIESNTSTNHRINQLNGRFNDCIQRKIENDSIRVVNNAGQFGCLSFTLIWNSTDDLDLCVLDARNDSIYYKKNCRGLDNKFSNAGGQLDIDLNAGKDIYDQPVENIYFKCFPPSGFYLAEIRAFEKREIEPVKFKLIVREKGRIIRELIGKISKQDELVKMINYNYHGN
jgi:hypothetical protein